MIRYFAIITLGLFLLPQLTSAEVLNSTNYNLENPSIDVGGENSNSTNYRSTDSIGNQGDAVSNSTNYKVFPGFVQAVYPGVPGVPTLTNTGGTLYNALDFIVDTGGNASDTFYAIAISDDDFVTTDYIQTGNTVGTSVAWQKYVDWGSGTGERVSGLSPSTTYKIKVKARFAADTETIFSGTASASTVDPSITFTISDNTIGFGSLKTGSARYATGTTGSDTDSVAHTIAVTTNGVGGYSVTYSGATMTSGSNTIDVASITDDVDGTPGSEEFGFSLTTDGDATITSGYAHAGTPDWAFIAGATTEFITEADETAIETFSIHYLGNIADTTESGSYTTTITYTVTGTF